MRRASGVVTASYVATQHSQKGSDTHADFMPFAGAFALKFDKVTLSGDTRNDALMAIDDVLKSHDLAA